MKEKKFKLPKKVKDKWVKALRSGKYKQGNGALKVDDKYCCLGVAKEIGLCKRISTPETELVSKNFLPMEIQDNLAERNDSGNWSFKRIATWIEKYL